MEKEFVKYEDVSLAKLREVVSEDFVMECDGDRQGVWIKPWSILKVYKEDYEKEFAGRVNSMSLMDDNGKVIKTFKMPLPNECIICDFCNKDLFQDEHLHLVHTLTNTAYAVCDKCVEPFFKDNANG